MKFRWNLLAVGVIAALTVGCGDSATTAPSGGGSSPPNIAGVYNYETDATTMSCSDGTSVPLPMGRDTLTITQMGNRFDGELAIAATIAAPADASFFEDCIINIDSTYGCSGEYRDDNAVIAFTSAGRFTSTGMAGSTSLRMTLTDGTVCTWTKQERGTKVS